MENQEIIQLIREGKREKLIRFLYQEFPKIKQLVLKEGLTKEHAEEIFQNNYSSTSSAKIQKYKCIEHAIKLSEQPETISASVETHPNVSIQPN